MPELTFKQFRDANMERQPNFKTRDGRPSTCNEWTFADWVVAFIGEFGEMCNVLKKVRRGDMTFDEAKQHIKDECADSYAYFDILACKMGVNPDPDYINKWNEISARIGYDVRLKHEQQYPDREALGADGSVRKAHYGEGEQPWDTAKLHGWAPYCAAFMVTRYLRRDKEAAHSLQSARWYFDRLVEMADDRQAVAIACFEQLSKELTTNELEVLVVRIV